MGRTHTLYSCRRAFVRKRERAIRREGIILLELWLGWGGANENVEDYGGQGKV